MVELAGIDHTGLVDLVLPGGVRGAMVKTERRLCMVEGLYPLRDGVDGGLMFVHCDEIENGYVFG